MCDQEHLLKDREAKSEKTRTHPRTQSYTHKMRHKSLNYNDNVNVC